MKNIAIIITRMIPGGASKVVLQIIDAASGKYDITLMTGREDLDEKTVNELSGKCNVTIIPSLVRNISPFKDYKAYKEILCELRKGNYDVVHTHTSKAGFIGRKAAIKANIPVIIHSPHGSIYTDGSNIEGVPSLSFGKKMLQFAEKSVGKFTTWLTTLSENEKKICLNLSLSKEENTVVIHNGIEIEKFSVTSEERKSVREKLGFAEDDIVLLSIGRLSSEKGHYVLIDAFEKVLKELGTRKEAGEEGGEHRTLELFQRKAEIPSNTGLLSFSKEKRKFPPTSNPIKRKLCLIIVGDGPEREALGKQAENLNLSVISFKSETNIKVSDIEDKGADIIFTGHSEDIKKYLAMSDIFILPSLYEGFGLVVLEAMAAGLPVIASRVGGIPEIVTDGGDGVLVAPSDPDLLYSSILELVASKEKTKRFGRSGRKTVKNFSVEKMQEAYLRLYE